MTITVIRDGNSMTKSFSGLTERNGPPIDQTAIETQPLVVRILRVATPSARSNIR